MVPSRFISISSDRRSQCGPTRGTRGKEGNTIAAASSAKGSRLGWHHLRSDQQSALRRGGSASWSLSYRSIQVAGRGRRRGRRERRREEEEEERRPRPLTQIWLSAKASR
jgi:hypothetical protein